ncbi:MAG: hypothetical protein HZB62_10170 [Nitrospirae bacterium]|nr:hypothetical protein [Nitrospirota bacterium]
METKRAVINLISLLCLLLFGLSNSYAASSNCVKALHKRAITDAINISPSGFRTIIKPLEGEMLDSIQTVHAQSKNDRLSYEDYFKNLTETLREQDPKRNDYLERMLTGITIYPFLKYLPIRTYDSCDAVRIIKEAALIYDGYDEQPNYSKLTNSDFAEHAMKFEGKTETERMKLFYNLLVNEIVDLWSNSWLHAGNKIDDLPMAGSVIKEGVIKKQTSNRIQPLAQQPAQSENSTIAAYSDADLTKYGNPTDAQNALGNDTECESLEQQLFSQKIRLGQGFYGDIMARYQAIAQYKLRCQKPNSTPGISSFGQSNGLPALDRYNYSTNPSGIGSSYKSGDLQDVYSQSSKECSSDFSCGLGYKCVKAPLKSKGECMKEVDKYGLPTYRAHSLNSIGPNMDQNGCNFNTDCPIGYRCDKKYKLCAK